MGGPCFLSKESVWGPADGQREVRACMLTPPGTPTRWRPERRFSEQFSLVVRLKMGVKSGLWKWKSGFYLDFLY